MQIKIIPLEEIEQTKNSRSKYKAEDLSQLMGSIKKEGLLQPIGVNKRGKIYEVVFGNRRYLAHKKLGLNSIPCVVYEDIGEEEFLVKNLIENVLRDNITMFALGKSVEELHEVHNLSFKEIAKRLDMPHRKLEKARDFFRHLPKKFAEKVVDKNAKGDHAGKMSIAVAEKVVRECKNKSLKVAQKEMVLNAVLKYDLVGKQIKTFIQLISEGKTVASAIKKLDQIKTITIQFSTIEKDYKKTVDFKAEAEKLLRKKFKLREI